MILTTFPVSIVFKHLVHAIDEGLLSRFYVCCEISTVTAILGFLGWSLEPLLLLLTAAAGLLLMDVLCRSK